ncbi:WXG100 family type VII secretion target [Micromonospora marina]|uniref:WXG100 family type VII secretion target n=1 Tax=Micromonospora marina TaxID=307120 RepID=UPI00345232AA
MTESLGVDTERLTAARKRLDALHTRLGAVSAGLRGRLGAEGNCWGDDKTGKSFAEAYVKPQNSLREMLPALAEVMKSVSDGVGTMAKGFARTEHRAAETTGRIGRPPSTDARR